MRNRTRAVLVVVAWPLLAAADGEPSAPPAVPEPAAASAHPAATLPSRKGFAIEAGLGKYEALHAGVAYHVTESAAFELFGGGGAQGYTTTASIGAGYSHALGRPIWTVEWGFDVKALYWTQSDPNYAWKMMSVVLGGFLVKDLERTVALKLDAGVALSGALQSDRKQDLNFAHPTRWNGSVCLELVYRLGGR